MSNQQEQRFVTRAELYSHLASVFIFFSVAFVFQLVAGLGGGSAGPKPQVKDGPLPLAEIAEATSVVAGFLRTGALLFLQLASVALALMFVILSWRERRRHASASPMPSEPLPPREAKASGPDSATG